MTQPSHPPLDERLTSIERTHRRLFVICAALAATMIATLAATYGRTTGTMRARGLEITDDSGRVRVTLGLDGGQPRLLLYDDRGTVRLTLTHDPFGTALFIHDSAGVTRVGAAQFAHGGGGFALHGPDSKGGAALYLKGGGSLTFYDTAGTITARLPGPAGRR